MRILSICANRALLYRLVNCFSLLVRVGPCVQVVELLDWCESCIGMQSEDSLSSNVGRFAYKLTRLWVNSLRLKLAASTRLSQSYFEVKTFDAIRRTKLRTERFIKEKMHNRPEKPILNGFDFALSAIIHNSLPVHFGSPCGTALILGCGGCFHCPSRMIFKESIRQKGKLFLFVGERS